MTNLAAWRRIALAGILAMSACLSAPLLRAQGSAATAPAPGVLKAQQMSELMPAQVFFRGQSATVQIRNSGGIRYADGMFTLMALVDTSGYSSGIQQRYQAYLITEVPLQLGDGAEAH